MPDYLSRPRQRGYSDMPTYEVNPRKFARSRCDKTTNAIERIMLNMGEIIQVYAPEGSLPSDMIEQGLDLINYCNENKIPLSSLLDMAAFGKLEIGTMGDMAGYIAMAALIMKTAEDLQIAVNTLRSAI